MFNTWLILCRVLRFVYFSWKGFPLVFLLWQEGCRAWGSGAAGKSPGPSSAHLPSAVRGGESPHPPITQGHNLHTKPQCSWGPGRGLQVPCTALGSWGVVEEKGPQAWEHRGHPKSQARSSDNGRSFRAGLRSPPETAREIVTYEFATRETLWLPRLDTGLGSVGDPASPGPGVLTRHRLWN